MTQRIEHRTGKGKLLIVDDSSTSRGQLKQALEREGFEVTEAAEGVEALWRTRQQRFDLVLTDIHMPTMDGLQFIAEMRKLPGYDSTPVYVVSSDCSRERIAEGRKLGATAWVVKPADIPQLIAAVSSAVSTRGP